LKDGGATLLFVLGNHDFYGSSIKSVRKQISNLGLGRVIYLTTLDSGTYITEDTVVIGHDGWYDARNGSYQYTTVELADFSQIKEFKNTYEKHVRLEVIQILADEAVEIMRHRLVNSCKLYKNIIAVTHVPPFADSATYKGKISDSQFQPFFSCYAMGKMMFDVMSENLDNNLTVLCGHSHGGNVYKPCDNITVYTAEAEYGKPAIQSLWSIK
jgi:Icc protein